MTDESVIIALIRESCEKLREWNNIVGASMESTSTLADECRETADKAEAKTSYASNMYEDDLAETDRTRDEIAKISQECDRVAADAAALEPRAAEITNRAFRQQSFWNSALSKASEWLTQAQEEYERAKAEYDISKANYDKAAAEEAEASTALSRCCERNRDEDGRIPSGCCSYERGRYESACAALRRAADDLRQKEATLRKAAAQLELASKAMALARNGQALAANFMRLAENLTRIAAEAMSIAAKAKASAASASSKLRNCEALLERHRNHLDDIHSNLKELRGSMLSVLSSAKEAQDLCDSCTAFNAQMDGQLTDKELLLLKLKNLSTDSINIFKLGF